MMTVTVSRKTVVGVGFAPAGDALFAATGRTLFRLGWPGGRATHTSGHLTRDGRPHLSGGVVATADGRAAAGGLWWEAAAGGRLVPAGPTPPGVVVAGSDPPAVLSMFDGDTFSYRPALLAADGRVLAELPYCAAGHAWQEDERSLLIHGTDGLKRCSRVERPQSVWRRLTGGPAELAWRLDAPFPDLPTGVGPVARHPAGAAVLLGVGVCVIEWDHRAGRERRRWRLPVGGVSSLAVSPDGLTAAAGGPRGSVVAFDLE